MLTNQFDTIQKAYYKKTKDIEKAESTIKNIQDVERLNQYTNNLELLKSDTEDKLNDAYDF